MEVATWQLWVREQPSWQRFADDRCRRFLVILRASRRRSRRSLVAPPWSL